MKYEVQVDVVMGMRIEVDADSKEDAEKKVKDKQYVPSDLRNAWHVANDIVEIIEKEKEKAKIKNFYLSADTVEKLEKLSKKYGISQSKIVSLCVEKQLSDE